MRWKPEERDRAAGAMHSKRARSEGDARALNVAATTHEVGMTDRSLNRFKQGGARNLAAYHWYFRLAASCLPR